MRPPLPPLLTPHRRRWLVALLANGLARAVLAAGGVVLLRLTLWGSEAPWSAALLLPALALGVVAVAALQRREMLDAEALAQHYIAHVRLRLFDRLATLTPDQAQKRSRGGVLLRFIGDVQALRNWVGRGIARGAVAGSTLLALWLLLFAVAPLLAAGVTFVLAAGGLVLWRLWGPLYEATAVARRRQAVVAAYMQDRIAGLSTLQSCGRSALERERLRRLNARLRRALQDRADWRGRHHAVTSLMGGALLIGLASHALGTLPGRDGLLSPVWLGHIAANSLLIMLMLPAVRTLGQVADAWVAAQVARARVAEFLDAGGPPPPTGASDAGERPTLTLRAPEWPGRVEGPEASVPYGSRIAICGPCGAGKSSLLQLVAGLQTPGAGAVCLDGISLRDLAPQSVAHRVALLSPDLPLLRGTVAENVLARARSAGPQELAGALALSGLDTMLAALPDGLETRVRDAGLNLSHGQRRAVQLARCLAARPAILLIDDPAACLPGDVEDHLFRLLDGFEGTVIFSTTSPTLAILADEIWTLEDGRRRAAWTVQRPATTPADAAAH